MSMLEVVKFLPEHFANSIREKQQSVSINFFWLLYYLWWSYDCFVL